MLFIQAAYNRARGVWHDKRLGVYRDGAHGLLIFDEFLQGSNSDGQGVHRIFLGWDVADESLNRRVEVLCATN